MKKYIILTTLLLNCFVFSKESKEYFTDNQYFQDCVGHRCSALPYDNSRKDCTRRCAIEARKARPTSNR